MIEKINFRILVFLMCICVFPSLHAQDDANRGVVPAGVSEAEQKANADAFANAYKFILLENTASAQSAFEAIVAQYKWDAASRYELARIYAGAGRLQDAQGLAEEAYKLDPSNKWYGELLGSLYEQTGNFKDLMTLLEEMLKKNPNNTDALEKMASVWMSEGRPAKAIDCLDKIEAISGISEELSLHKQRIYAGMKKNREAANELVKLSEAFPDEDRYKVMLAEFYGETGDYKQAIKIYDQLLAKDPEDVYTAISMADMYQKMGDRDKVYSTLKKAFASTRLGAEPKLQVFLTLYTPEQIYDTEKEQALDLVTVLVQAHPSDPKLLAIKGDLLYKKGENAGAYVALKQSLTADSSRYFVWEQMLFVLSSLNDSAGLESYSSRCRQLFPFQPVPYLFEGMMKARQGNHPAAAKLFADGKALVSGNSALSEQFAMFLGDTYHQMNEIAKSDSAYEEALRYNPDNTYVLNNYAYYLSVRNEQLAKAEKMSAKAIAAEPNNATFLDTYAWVLYKLGRYEESLYWMQKTLAADESPSATLYEHAGDILFKLNRVDEAVDMWQKAINLDPSQEKIKQKIERRTVDE